MMQESQSSPSLMPIDNTTTRRPNVDSTVDKPGNSGFPRLTKKKKRGVGENVRGNNAKSVRLSRSQCFVSSSPAMWRQPAVITLDVIRESTADRTPPPSTAAAAAGAPSAHRSLLRGTNFYNDMDMLEYVRRYRTTVLQNAATAADLIRTIDGDDDDDDCVGGKQILLRHHRRKSAAVGTAAVSTTSTATAAHLLQDILRRIDEQEAEQSIGRRSADDPTRIIVQARKRSAAATGRIG